MRFANKRRLRSRRVLLTTMLATLSLGSAAIAGPPPVLPVDDLPQGTVKTDGKSPLYLLVRISGGKVIAFENATQKSANVTATFSPTNGTTIKFTSTLDVALKFDLYISSDGRRFEYTSSCPLMAQKGLFENWPHAVPWLAITAVVVADNSGSCR